MKKFDKIYVEITNICNLKCKFCDEGNRDKAYMSIENFKTIINQVKEYTKLVALHIKGEPLLHPKLKQMLDILAQNNLLANITTNATLLENNIEILGNSKAVRQLNLSIHAMSENEMDVLKNIEKTVDVVKRLKQINSELIISYRLWNVEDILENDKNSEILEILGKTYNINNIIERSKNEKFIELGNKIFLNQDIEFEWPSLKKEIISNEGKCYGLRKQIGILVNGDVIPCCLDQDGIITLGNILTSDLSDILNSNRAMDIEKGFCEGRLIEELCKRCGFVNKRLK